jgi:hypothetical protein
MKKFLVLVAAIMVAFSISGCNKQIIDLNYKFDKAYIVLGEEVKEVSIKSWNDYEASDMVQINTTDGDVYLTHSTNVILVGG